MQLRHSLEIGRSPLALWPYLVDHDKLRSWMQGLEQVEALRGAPDQPGAVHRLWVREGRAVAQYTVTNVAIVPPVHHAVDMTGGSLGSLVLRIDHRLHAVEAGTRLVRVTSCRLRGWWLLATPVFRFLAGVQARTWLGNLKRVAEAGSSDVSVGKSG